MRPLLGVLLSDPFDELVAVHPRHHQIEENQVVVAVMLQLIEPDLPVFRQLDGELHSLEYRLQQNANGKVVVDDQYPSAASVDFSSHEVVSLPVFPRPECETHTGLRLSRFNRLRHHTSAGNDCRC